MGIFETLIVVGATQLCNLYMSFKTHLIYTWKIWILLFVNVHH